jgi:hypothetical protein
MTMGKQSNDPRYQKHLVFVLLAPLLLPSGAIALVSDVASAQIMPQVQQQGQLQVRRTAARIHSSERTNTKADAMTAALSNSAIDQQGRLQVRRTATRIHPPERTNTKPDATMVALPNSGIDNASALGQALAACNQDAAVQEGFTLPGLKGEVTLDHCYKGRAHLICVFAALGKGAKFLTDTYTKIVDAKYPNINSVDDGVCKLNRETLASDIVGSEDFAKRFKELKSQYEAATNCAGNIEQAFKDATLTDMAQPAEIIKSMVASMDGDIAKTSEAQNQAFDLAEKMELSQKAMKTIAKIHRALCINENALAQSSAKRF